MGEGKPLATRPPVRFSATPASIGRHAPLLGEHTAEPLAGADEAAAPEPQP